MTANQKPTKKKVTFVDYLTAEDILFMLRRRLHWLLLCTLVISGVTFAFVWFMPDVYRAETLILVEAQKVPEKYVTATVSGDVGGRLNTISQEIMSSTRLQKLIDDNDLYRNMRGRATVEEIIERMRKDIEVKVIRNADASNNRSLGAFRIAYQGQNPGVVAQVCGQLASLFIDQNLKTREQQAEGTSDFLETQLVDAKKNLEKTEAAVRDFKLRHVGELPEQSNANVATLSRLQIELQAQTEALNRARQQEVYLQALLASTGGATGTAAATDKEAGAGAETKAAAGPLTSVELTRLEQRQALLQASLDDLKSRYKEDHPDVRRAEANLREVTGQVATERERLSRLPPAAAAAARSGARTTTRAAAGIDPRVGIQDQIKMLDVEIKNRTAAQDKITAQIRTYQAHLDNMPVREQEIVGVMRDYEMSKTFYQSLLEKKMAADMASDLEKRQQSERFTILDPPRVPEKPLKPNRPVLYGAGLIAGLCLGLALIAVLELKDGSIRKEEEIAEVGLPIIARIPVVTTEAEIRVARRRSIVRWAVGSVATVAGTGVLAVAAAFVAKSL